MPDQFFLSLITAIFVGGAAAYLGSLLIIKRMALAGDALGHVALPGMGLALVFGFNVFWGAFLFLLLGVFLIWLFEIKTSLPLEALVGIVFVTSLALGFLIVPEPELLEALIGDISQVSLKMTVVSVILSLFSILAINRLYPGLILANISEDLAKVQKIEIKKYQLFYLLLIALIVALGIRVTGSLLVGALVIIPAAAARNLSKGLKEYTVLSLLIGVFGCLIGILLLKIIQFPAGPLIILTNTLIFVLSIFFKR